MNRNKVLSTIGLMLKVEAGLMLLPIIVSLIYGEGCIWSLMISAGIALGVGFLLSTAFRPKDEVIYAREGFVIVALAWLVLSAIGALPFTLSGEIPNYIDAFFETVSGFTTTGASILTDVEAMSNGLLFWRSFTHWVGGMGVLMFIMAIVPSVSDRSIHIMRAEVPGPIVGKIVPRAKDTAKILYLIYIVLTLVQIVFLLCGGMPLFDSILHAFGTAGTGGFGIKADSLAGYSPYLQWVITIFMFIFGVNFNVYYMILIRRFRAALGSRELWCYAGIVGVSIALIAANILPRYHNFSDALRHSAFQVSSIISTTGYATADFNLWPQLSKGILLILMMIGACAGSTAGGLKVSRAMILFKTIQMELRHMLHPRSVNSAKLEGKSLDSATLKSTSSYFIVYALLMVSLFFILCFDGFDIETNLSAAVSCFNNVGPGLAGVGPAANYSAYSGLSKLVLSFAMLMGRLEIFPLLLTLSPSTWAKK